jgi:hypothetical protein
MPQVTQTDIVAQMRAALSVSEPDLDTTIGSTTRKILDAVAEVVAESLIDKLLLDYQYDIDAKSGQDLDDFVALFGFNRLPAKRATGTVIFSRREVATANILITAGTQVATEGTPPIVASTILSAVIPIGDNNIEIPVQAVIGGTQGNVVANSLRFRVTAIDGVTDTTNPQALTGGTDQESDEQLRSRFKRTVFRNLAGTEQMFLGVALDDAAVTHANVLGASKRFREQIEIVGGTATSSIQDAAYVYANSSVLGLDIDAGDIFIPDVQYTFNDSVPPSVTVVDSVAVPDGVYDLEFEYVSTASRNDPSRGITNRIDIWLDGDRPTEASSVTMFRTSKVFNTTPGDPLNRSNFQRHDYSNPVAGNYFIQYPFGPVTDPSLSDQLNINGVIYHEGVDYFLVNDITKEGGTATSMSGIEFKSIANGLGHPLPADLSVIAVDYVFNAVPRDVASAVDAWKLVTTDVRVHQAKQVLLDLYLAVIILPGFTASSVLSDLRDALSKYVSGVGFNGAVQVSDLLEVAHMVQGVDAVRFMTSTDNGTHYAIQQVNPLGTLIRVWATNVVGQPRRATDVLVGDDELPVLNDVQITVKAQNTWGVV